MGLQECHQVAVEEEARPFQEAVGVEVDLPCQEGEEVVVAHPFLGEAEEVEVHQCQEAEAAAQAHYSLVGWVVTVVQGQEVQATLKESHHQS